MNNRTIPSELTLHVNGVEARYIVDPDFSYCGANCDVFAARSQEDGEPVIIKMFRFAQRRERELGIIRQLSDRYGLASGNYFMGFCCETDSEGQSFHPYCHIFRRINGRPLHQETVALSGKRDHHFLVRTLQTFLGFLEGVTMLHDLKYAHWDVKPSNIYCFQATSRDPLIIQLIDFDTVVHQSAFPTPSAARNLFSMYAKEAATGSLPTWYFSDEIRQAQKLLSEDNALALAQSLDLAACARILAYMIFAPEKPVSMSLDEINLRLRNASMTLGTKNALRCFFHRALHEDFAKRFSTCTEMQAYLEQLLEGVDENREVTSLHALRIRLGDQESKKSIDFYKKFDADILSEFQGKDRSYASLREVLEGAPPCTLITGEGGIGKTYALKNEYYRRLYARDESSGIALYVELKGKKAVEDITAELDDLRRDLRATGLRVPITVFLDAFDESPMDEIASKNKSRGKAEKDKGNGPGEFLSYLRELQKECRVVVTCRHHIESTQSGLGENPVFSSVVSTVGLRDEQIEQYLEKKRLCLNVQSQNTPLVQLLKNPLMLSLFAGGWDDARGTKNQADFLRVTNEVELIEQYIWNRFDTKNHTNDYTFEDYQKDLALMVRCLCDYDGRIADFESGDQKLIEKALRNLNPVAVLSEGKITCTHQVFADYFSALVYAGNFERVHQALEAHTDRKGLPTGAFQKSYVDLLKPITDKRYRHPSDNTRRFRGIMIAKAETESTGNIYERLEARTRKVFEYHDWLCRGERHAFGIAIAWLAIGIALALPMAVPYWLFPEQFTAVASSMTFFQRMFILLPCIIFWGSFIKFCSKYLYSYNYNIKDASNTLFTILCICQRYGDGEMCVMPPTVSECRSAELDPRCKKLILGRDYSGEYDNLLGQATALKEIDCTHNRRFRFEGGCLYYKSRILRFVSGKDGNMIHVHIPKGIVLKEVAYEVYAGEDIRFVQLSGEGRLQRGCRVLSEAFDLYFGIIFDGTPAQWRHMSKSCGSFFRKEKQLHTSWHILYEAPLIVLPFMSREGIMSMCGFEISRKEVETLKNSVNPAKNWVYFTQGEPNVSQVVNDVVIPDKAYMGSKFVHLSCPTAEVIGRGAFAFSTARVVELPVCVIIGAGAFYHAMHLTRIKCSRVETIERLAFNYCDSLTEITFEGSIAEWQAVEKKGAICNHPLLIRCTDGDWTEIPPER